MRHIYQYVMVLGHSNVHYVTRSLLMQGKPKINIITVPQNTGVLGVMQNFHQHNC